MEEEGIGPRPEAHLGVTEGGNGQGSMLTRSPSVWRSLGLQRSQVRKG